MLLFGLSVLSSSVLNKGINYEMRYLREKEGDGSFNGIG